MTKELSAKHGWGRYSRDLITALQSTGDEVAQFEDLLPRYFNYFCNYFLAPFYAWRLFKYTKDFDVIHAFIEPYAYIAYWLSKLSGKPYYVTIHGTYGVLPYTSFYKKFFHKKALTEARALICISEYTKERMNKFNLSNLSVIHNGIYFNNFYTATPILNRKPSNIISVGMLKYRKGQHIAIEAFARVREIHKEAKYCIVGDPDDKEYTKSLHKLVFDLSLGDSVTFLDHISNEELFTLYQEATLFVLTPTNYGSNFEGFGLVYLEANASGLPVIGTFGSGAENAVINEKTGILVPQEDVAQTAQAILRILKDKELWENLSLQGVAWARTHDWSNIVKQYKALYEKR